MYKKNKTIKRKEIKPSVSSNNAIILGDLHTSFL